jgi:two-component sensor histidine kinase/TPR repeat protein
MGKQFLLCRLILLLIVSGSKPQSSSAQKFSAYSIPMQRLQLKIVGSYAHGVYQGAIDEDSAIVLASESEHLSRSLYYDEVYNPEGGSISGKTLIDKNDIQAAIQLLNHLNGADKILLQLQLGAYYLYKPGEAKSDMDSSLAFLQAASAGSNSGSFDQLQNDTRTILGMYYFKNGEYKKAGQLFSGIINTVQKKENKKAIAQALANRGIFSPDHQPGKLADLNKALTIFKEQKDTVKEIEMLTRIFEVYFFQGDIDTVRTGLLKILDLENAIGFRQTEYNYNVLSYIAQYQAKMSDQFAYGMQAVKIMELNGDRAFEDFFYLRVAAMFGTLNDIDESLFWYNKAVDRSNPNRNKRHWYPLFIDEVYTLLDVDRYKESIELVRTTTSEFPPVNTLDKMLLTEYVAKSFMFVGRLDSAKFYTEQSIYYAELLKDDAQAKTAVADAYAWASQLYIATGKLDRARYFLKLATRLANSGIGIQSHIARSQYKIDSSDGNFEQAFHYYQRYRKLDDSLDIIKKSKELQALRIQYDIAKKDKDLELNAKNIQVLTTESRLQESRAQQAKTIRDVIIGSAIMLLLLLVLLYKRYVNKQKRNLQLEENQKEISAKNTALTKLLSENEWLLREVHHRVKNNLQIVMSLLNSQTAYLQDESAQKAILESQHRVQTMSLIHQKLYKSKNVSSIYMPEYIRDLLEYLKDSFKTRNTIRFELEVEPIDLDVMHAVPVGLILNEIITNAIKYAFPDNPDARIMIKLLKTNKDNLLLYISDNGKGFPVGFDLEKDSSFGMILIKGLTEDLDGTVSIQSDSGITIQMEFKNVSANSYPVHALTS